MRFYNKYFLSLLLSILSFNAIYGLHIKSIRSGDWYDATIWDAGRVPKTLDAVTISSNTHVIVNNIFYTDCDSLTVNGTFETGPANFTIGGRDLQIDARAIRNTECLINGSLIIKSDFSNTFKVYGNVRFAAGSRFEMTGGQFMIDGCGFTEALSVAANKPLLDVSGATTFISTGGIMLIFNPHFHASGVTVKGAKIFHSISFGHNVTLPNFAARVPNDFVISDLDKPIFNSVRLAYLPHSTRQNRVILNNITVKDNLDVLNGVLVGAGRFKVAGNVLLTENGRIETDLELNGSYTQEISNYATTGNAVIKGNVYINNPDGVRVKMTLTIEGGALIFQKGKFDLNGKTLTLDRSPQGADSTRFFQCKNRQTTATGTLRMKKIVNTAFFPVGTETNYLPVTLSAATGDFSVSTYPLSIAVPNNLFAIKNQWDITQLAGSTAANVTVQWNGVDGSFADWCEFFDGFSFHKTNG